MRADPILAALVTPAGAGLSAQAHVRCGWCEATHSHSASAGHRAAHCIREESPYRATGYDLDIRGSAATAADLVPDAPYAGHRCLREALEGAGPGLRSALLRATIAGRIAHAFDKRVGRARINVCGNSWSIDRDAFPADAEIRLPRPRRPLRVGRDFITLLAALYGIDLGIVGLRLLEIVSGASFDAEGKLVIASAIEAAYARKAEGRDGRP